MTAPTPGGANVVELGILLLLVVTLVVHIAFAIGVYRDSALRRRNGFRTWFAPPEIWAAAALVGSVVVAALYWLMHYSTLVPGEKAE